MELPVTEKLTVLIPVKNERLNIRPCIEAARKIADEILVADSGSTDDTMEIVRSLGDCRLIQREWVGYADFKNWAIQHATHSWVLIVDGDERVTAAMAEEIRQLMLDPPKNIDGYWVGFRGYFMGHRIRFSGWNTHSFRLIRRDVCRYTQRRVHEEIHIDKKRTGKLKNKFDHYTYWTYDRYFEKYCHYTKLGSEELWDRGKRTSFTGLLVRPTLRFLQLYILKLGFLDGLPGLQVCMLAAFFNTFVKQARLWEREHALPQPDPEAEHRAKTAESTPALSNEDRSAA